jgi:UDP-N-acetyl-D-mannosaminuronate dehydrogenase
MYLWNDSDATVVREARAINASMPEYAVRRLAEVYGDLTGAGVLVWGAAYRGGVKETAFSGVFPVVEALRSRGAEPYVSDPLYTADELSALGLPPYSGQTVTAVVVQADHGEYRDLGSDQFPDVRVVVDGRRITDPGRWAGAEVILLGAPSPAAQRA